MKHTESHITGIVAATERLPSSNNGNPRYTVVIQDQQGNTHITRTSPDSAIAYQIDNPEYRDNNHEYTLRLYRGYLTIQNVKKHKLTLSDFSN